MALVQVHNVRKGGEELLRSHAGERHMVLTGFDRRVAALLGKEKLQYAPSANADYQEIYDA